MESENVFQRIPVAGGVRDHLRVAATAAHARFARGLSLLSPVEDFGQGVGVVKQSGGVSEHDSDMTHAWLFTGPAGSGRSVAARAFAAALLCSDHENPGDEADLGCRTALAGTHGDLNLVRTEGSIISVDTARELREWAYKMPNTASCRVVIIEDADRLTEEASNAILKVVEEPPSRTVIIMCAPTANPEDFSVTLRSRCRHVYIPTPQVSDVIAVLKAENPSLNDDQLRWAAAVSNGHIGRARGLVNDEGTRQWRALALDFVEAVFNPAKSYLISREIASKTSAEAKRRLEPVEQQELEKLEEALGIGATGKGAQAALRGTKGVLEELKKEQTRRRKRVEKDLIDFSLTDIMGLFRDAMLLKSGAPIEEISDINAAGAGEGLLLINPDRRRTAEELARRVSSEGLLKCIDAVTEVRDMLDITISPTVRMDRLMAMLQIACRVGER